MLTCGKDDLLKLTDWRSFQVERTLRAPSFHVGGVWCRACFGADERHAAAGSADGTLHVWSVSCLTSIPLSVQSGRALSIGHALSKKWPWVPAGWQVLRVCWC